MNLKIKSCLKEYSLPRHYLLSVAKTLSWYSERETLSWVISTFELTLKVNGTCSRIYLQSLWKHNVTARSISGLKSETFSYRARKHYECSKHFTQKGRQYWLIMQHVCINLNTVLNDSTLKNSSAKKRSGLCSFSEWY